MVEGKQPVESWSNWICSCKAGARSSSLWAGVIRVSPTWRILMKMGHRILHALTAKILNLSPPESVLTLARCPRMRPQLFST